MADQDKKAIALLADHAKSRDTILFTEEVRHGRIRFFKNTIARFEDPAAAAYFDIGFNGTEFSDEEPTVVITNEELNFDPEGSGDTIDPHTVIGNGREGVAPGITVHGVARGDTAPGGDYVLGVDDVEATTKG